MWLLTDISDPELQTQPNQCFNKSDDTLIF